MSAPARVTVLGLGTFGGQIAVARYFARKGSRVVVTDKKSAKDLAGSVAQLEGLGIDFVLGEHRAADFTATDLVVRSPAVPADHELVRAAEAAGVPVTTEILLTLEQLRAPYFAVTGTKGKSTTTSLLGAFLAAGGGAVRTGGNIGRPLLEEVEGIGADERVVFELSSFMAEDIAIARAKARAARDRVGAKPLPGPRLLVITSLSPEHLDRHGTKQSYYEAKLSLVDSLEPGSALIYSARGELGTLAAERAARRSDLRLLPVCLEDGARTGSRPSVVRLEGARLVRSDTGAALFSPAKLTLPGAHNVENAALAALAANELGVGAAALDRALETYAALPHRLETVARDRDGRRYVNDSIATTPEAAIAALKAFEGQRVALLLGGAEKGSDYRDLAREAARRAHAVVCLGKTGPQLAALVTAEVAALGVPVLEGRGARVVLAPGSFEDAFALAREMCPAGGVVLLSPACASYDMFRNFEARGDLFRELAAM